VDVLAASATTMNTTTRHQFLNRQTLYSGRKPKTAGDILDKVLALYHELRDNNLIATLNMIAAEARPIYSRSKARSLGTIHRQIYWHLYKYGVVYRRVTRVAQNTRYDEGIKAGCVAFANYGLKSVI
jgi:hypothetical protein